MPEDNKIGNISPISAGDDFGIKADDSPFAVSFYFEDYYDDRACKKFINNVERLIRQSKEYKTYIELLRTNIVELNHDNILGNITTADVDLEFHHYPFTLYDIIEILMIHHIANKEKFTSFSIAKEVMELHYEHLIGLVPLTKTTHELAHAGSLFISSKQIFGKYREFMTRYKDGIPAEKRGKVEMMEKYTEDGIPSDFKGLFK